MKPLIGLSGRRWPIESLPKFAYPALSGEEVDVHLSEFPKAVRAAGGLPVQLTRDSDTVEIVARLDGLVMTGGADPDPALYGHDPHPELGAVERARDDWELSLIVAALDARLPMLCVCRGAQLLNIALGGTLHQHLDQADDHARWDVDRTDRCHLVQFAPGSRAAELYGAEWSTNSLHHQAVNAVGDGITVTGATDDGVVEAFEVEGRPEIFAVQWHPEMLGEQPDPSFTWLVGHAALRRG
jgi:putative glutamine amidotransferase